jgi:hypothetical protein
MSQETSANKNESNYAATNDKLPTIERPQVLNHEEEEVGVKCIEMKECKQRMSKGNDIVFFACDYV